MKTSASVALFLTAAALIATCGCSATAGPGPGGTSAKTAVSATAAPSTTTPAAQAAAARRCASSALQIKTAPGSGEAMDGVYQDLIFTNIGTATCTLYGYPGVSFLTSGHTPLTAPAARVLASPHQVTLAHGQVASTQIKTPNVGNQPNDACHQVTATVLKVYPPDETVPVYVPAEISVCAGHAPGGSIWPIVPGSNAGV